MKYNTIIDEKLGAAFLPGGYDFNKARLQGQL
jgi:hypothetical protein